MTHPITVSVDQDGAIEYTRTNQITLFEGAGEMQRVTDIQKLDDRARYFIAWKLGPFARYTQTPMHAEKYGVALPPNVFVSADNHAILFPSYDAAVSHEIAMLNAMRKQGVTFYEPHHSQA